MTAVGDILELSYGKALRQADRTGGSVPVVGSGGVVGGHSQSITEGPTIVIGRKGSIGSVTWIDGPAWPIDTAYFVKPRSENILERWIYWTLKSLNLASMNKSAAIPGLNRDDVYRLDVWLPPLHEQGRIAAILDHADSIRAKRRQVLARLDALPQVIFNKTFGRTPWSATLGDLAEVQIGPFGSLLHKEDYVSGGIPVLNPMHIRGGALQPDLDFSVAVEKAAELSRYQLKVGDIVLGRRGEMGRAGVAHSEHQGMLCGTGSLILRPTSVSATFLHAVVTSPRMKDILERNALGATLPNLNASIVRSAPAPRALGKESGVFAESIRTLNAQRCAFEDALAADDELFTSLQARAFRGEL